MSIPNLIGLRSFAKDYKAFIVDLWGVVYEEDRLCFGAFNALSRLKEQGIEVVFLSNSPRRVADTIKKLERLGVNRSMYQGVLTSGEIIYYEMKTRIDPFFKDLGRKCFHLGPEMLWNSFKDLGYTSVPNIEEADFILLTGTFGTDDSLDKYDPFFKSCLKRRLPFVCVCPDSFILKNGRPHLSAGALAAQYQNKGGDVFWRGKPSQNVFDYCCEGMKTKDKNKIAVIGDGVSTDIFGANGAHLDAYFVAGGVYSKELGITRGDIPETIRVEALFRQNGCFAKATLPAFVW